MTLAADVASVLADLLAERLTEPQAREKLQGLVCVKQLALAPELAPTAREDADREAARRLFDYWRTRCGHPRAKEDPTRIAKAIARIRDGFSEEELRWAIDGMAGSTFHSGANDDQKRYDDMELCFRSVRHTERFIEIARGKNGTGASPREERQDERAKLRAEAQKAMRDGRTDDYNRLIRKLREL